MKEPNRSIIPSAAILQITCRRNEKKNQKFIKSKIKKSGDSRFEKNGEYSQIPTRQFNII